MSITYIPKTVDVRLSEANTHAYYCFIQVLSVFPSSILYNKHIEIKLALFAYR